MKCGANYLVFNLENKTLYVVLSLRFESHLSEFGDVDLDLVSELCGTGKSVDYCLIYYDLA